MRDCLSESDSSVVFLWLEGRVHGPEGKPTLCFKTQRQNSAEGSCHYGAPIRALASTVQTFTRCYWTVGSESGDKLSLMSLQLCLGLFLFLSHAGRVPDFHFASKLHLLSSRTAIKPNFKKKTIAVEFQPTCDKEEETQKSWIGCLSARGCGGS